MPRWILLVLLVFLSLVTSQAQTVNAQVEAGWTNVNLRTEPNRNGTVVAELAGETALIVTARTADYIWYQVQTLEGQSGWVASRYVQLLVPQNSIPVFEQLTNTTVVTASTPVTGSGEGNGRVIVASLNMRSAPDIGASVLAELPQRTSVLIAGRSSDGIWLYIQTADGLSGWVATRFIQLDIALSSVPVVGNDATTSNDTVNAPVVAGQAPFFTLGGAAGNIFVTGQTLGNRANVFSKVGDSMTVGEEMFRPIGYGVYNLGGYGYLQTTINFFMAGTARTDNPFNNTSLAATGGWTTENVLNPQFANSSICNVGESPLACEYRLNKPAVALIMLGSNDTTFIAAEQFAYNIRLIANISIEAGVIPVFSTIPPRGQYPGRAEEYNQAIINVAQELGLPLWDFYSALMTLPNAGMSEDGLHVSSPPRGFEDAANFTGDFLQYGYVMRNLTMLQVLDVLRANVLQ
jgi:uncharacterized protein YgiM (DUF1202 family)